MIIIGLSTKEKTRRAGQFHCPACQQRASYAKIVRARRFTLFFIPLIPLGSSGTGRVVCENCGSEYSESMIAAAE